MAGNTSKVQISSNALILIGHPPIASFEEPGAGAVAAANLYEQSYLNMLTMYRWRFATKRGELNRLAQAPTNGFQYQYQLPHDLVYLIKKDLNTDYEIYEDKMYTNDAQVKVDYTYRVDEDRLPAYFVKAFEFFLAMQFSIPVTGNSTRAQEYQGMYELQLKRAKYADSSQRPQDTFTHNPYVDTRF